VAAEQAIQAGDPEGADRGGQGKSSSQNGYRNRDQRGRFHARFSLPPFHTFFILTSRRMT
jgi:hypothetical protein